jgi:RIO kinase 1
MRVPDSLTRLIEEGIIDRVVGTLKSGKEANVYAVEIEGGHCVAKVYKDVELRTFKHRTAYTEGRVVRNSRDQRAMQKRTNYGKKKDDEAWRVAEVDAMYRLRAAGVRVPEPYHFVEDVLLMEFILDGAGTPAPRLSEAKIDRSEASLVLDQILKETVKMLAVGVVHGDLSEFNILMGADGPVIIDFPQWLDASKNQNARKLLIRDLDNLMNFLKRIDPNVRIRPYGEEMWQAFEQGELTPDTVLTGNYRAPVGAIDLKGLENEIRSAEADHRRELARKAGTSTRTPRPSARRSVKKKPAATTTPATAARPSTNRPSSKTRPASPQQTGTKNAPSSARPDGRKAFRTGKKRGGPGGRR